MLGQLSGACACWRRGGGEAAGGWACWRAALGGAMGYAGVSGGGSWDRRVHKERILSNSVEYFHYTFLY